MIFYTLKFRPRGLNPSLPNDMNFQHPEGTLQAPEMNFIFYIYAMLSALCAFLCKGDLFNVEYCYQCTQYCPTING